MVLGRLARLRICLTVMSVMPNAGDLLNSSTIPPFFLKNLAALSDGEVPQRSKLLVMNDTLALHRRPPPALQAVSMGRHV
jgi:hypothetical protein